MVSVSFLASAEVATDLPSLMGPCNLSISNLMGPVSVVVVAFFAMSDFLRILENPSGEPFLNSGEVEGGEELVVPLPLSAAVLGALPSRVRVTFTIRLLTQVDSILFRFASLVK